MVTTKIENRAGGNFCAHYLGLLTRIKKIDKITDGYNELDTIKVFDPLKFKYLKPRWIYDKFGKKDVFIPIIEEVNYNDVKQLGFVIVLFTPNKKWYYNQRVAYKLVKRSLLKTQNYLLQIPMYHSVQFDRANNLIRLVGKSSGLLGFGEWSKI